MKECGYLIVKGQKKKSHSFELPSNHALGTLYFFSNIKGISNNNNHKDNKLKGHIS